MSRIVAFVGSVLLSAAFWHAGALAGEPPSEMNTATQVIQKVCAAKGTASVTLAYDYAIGMPQKMQVKYYRTKNKDHEVMIPVDDCRQLDNDRQKVRTIFGIQTANAPARGYYFLSDGNGDLVKVVDAAAGRDPTFRAVDSTPETKQIFLDQIDFWADAFKIPR